jgi:hypothetical protein
MPIWQSKHDVKLSLWPLMFFATDKRYWRGGGEHLLLLTPGKKPVLLLTHGCQEPYYYCAYKRGPLLKAIMLHFEAVLLGGGGWGGWPIHVINSSTWILFFWDMMLHQWVTVSDYLLMQHHIPEKQNLHYIVVKTSELKSKITIACKLFYTPGMGFCISTSYWYHSTWNVTP